MRFSPTALPLVWIAWAVCALPGGHVTNTDWFWLAALTGFCGIANLRWYWATRTPVR